MKKKSSKIAISKVEHWLKTAQKFRHFHQKSEQTFFFLQPDYVHIA